MSWAYRAAEENLVSPFEYVALPMAVLWGYPMRGDLPESVAWLGMSMIIGGGLIVFTARPCAAACSLPVG